MYSYGPPHMAELKQDVQLEYTYRSYVLIRDVALNTCQRRWTIGKCGERGSEISVLAGRHDDDFQKYTIEVKSMSYWMNNNQQAWNNLDASDGVMINKLD